MLLRNIDVSLLELAQDPTRARDFLRGMRHPRHLAATAQVRARIDLARVVERHASACLRTMGVVSLCGVVVTRRRRYVGARIVPSPRITMETVV